MFWSLPFLYLVDDVHRKRLCFCFNFFINQSQHSFLCQWKRIWGSVLILNWLLIKELGLFEFSKHSIWTHFRLISLPHISLFSNFQKLQKGILWTHFRLICSPCFFLPILKDHQTTPNPSHPTHHNTLPPSQPTPSSSITSTKFF